MPKTVPDYSNTIIYKLCCNNPEITDIYIGHTTNFIMRKNQHKNNCKNPNLRCYNYYVYQFIRENGGFDNWAMIEIVKVNCIDKKDSGSGSTHRWRGHTRSLAGIRYPFKRD